VNPEHCIHPHPEYNARTLLFRSRLLSHKLLFPVIMTRYVHSPGWLLCDGAVFKDRRLHLHDSAAVYAWPSTGGRLELENPSAFELDILDIEIILRRAIGRPYQYGIRRNELKDAEIYTWLGWPEDEEHKGGVWVLKKSEMRFENRMTGRIRLAKTMQDRCRAVEMCCGIFYAHPTDEHLVSTQPD